MSKSDLPKWFNPTGNDIWDDYYTVFWMFVFGLVILIVGVIVGANL